MSLITLNNQPKNHDRVDILMSAGTGVRPSNRVGAALIVALCALAASLTLEPLFMTNDDSALAMIGAGFGIASHPEPHLIFAHYGYGIIVGLLSRIIGPAAHGWITLCSLTGCLFLLVKAVFLARGFALSAYLWVIILFCAFTGAMIEPQFTITSALLFVSGITYALVLDTYKRLSISDCISV